MFETLSILTFIYVAIVLAYIRKLIIRMQQDNMRQIEDLQKIYAKLVDQQNQLAEHKIDIQNEASKVFTLYDMTREVTRTRSQQDAFEIFKDKLHQNVHYVKCELSDAPCPEVTNFMGKNGRFFFRLRNKETEMGHIMIDRLETEDKDKAVILCHQFALALRRVKLYQEIEQTAITASHTWNGVSAVRSVMGERGSSGRTTPLRMRNWTSVRISAPGTRRAHACSFSRARSSSTVRTVSAMATHAGWERATAPRR